MEYQCPFCDYTDQSRESVEAHISGSSNSLHAGKVGRMYRSDIEESGQPETVKERLLGGSGKEQARISEIEDLKEQNKALRDEVEELNGQVRKLAEMIAQVQGTVQDETIEPVEGIKDDVEETESRVSALESAMGSADGLLTDLVRFSDSSVRCPVCNKEVNFRYDHKNDRVYCPGCNTIPVAGYLEKA
jgi:seryl-tRNA synthetase